ncbi:MAG TPA: PQQ-dependent dehydrogenase, methanol/ethanol family [Sphingobium sp.]
MRMRWVWGAGALALTCSAMDLVAQLPQPPAEGTGADWHNVGGSADESGFSQLGNISTGNIGKLGLAWSLDLDGEVSLEATPLAVDGILYFSGSYGAVYAVDGTTGKQLWRYDPEIWKVNPMRQGMGMGVNRGVAYDNGQVFIGVLDGRLVALDAKTGKVNWSVNTLPGPGTMHSLTGAPRTFNGKVIIGNGGADIGQRGYVTAYDQKTGAQAWRFWTVPGKPEDNAQDPVMAMAAKTWNGQYWKTGTGGTVWNGMTFDPELNRIYIGVGNAGPYDPERRSPGGGDNLFVASIVALDADTGKYVWHYQQNPRESWDYKAVANMISATIPIDGKPRKVLMQQPTNGFFYVLDRETGKLISAEKVGKVTWASHIDMASGRPVEAPNVHYQDGPVDIYPSTLGSHNWQAMSYSPKTGLVYIPYMQVGARYAKATTGALASITGASASFITDKKDKEDLTGALVAWDPVAQKARWRMPRSFLWNGGTLATAGNLVFQGTADGHFRAHDAANGKELWKFNAGLGIISAPMSYSVKGKQYVSVLVGWGGTAAAATDVLNVGWKYGRQPRRILSFAVGGTKKLPASPPRDMKVTALDDPSIVLDEKAIAAGREMSFVCGACHGMAFRGAGAPGPDLRESALALSEDAFYQVVQEGALSERGMPRFPLGKPQIHNLWSYLRATAREALGTRKPDAAGTAGGPF